MFTHHQLTVNTAHITVHIAPPPCSHITTSLFTHHLHTAPPPRSHSSTSAFTQLHLPDHTAAPPRSHSSTSTFTQLHLPDHTAPPPRSHSSTSAFTQLHLIVQTGHGLPFLTKNRFIDYYMHHWNLTGRLTRHREKLRRFRTAGCSCEGLYNGYICNNQTVSHSK